MPELSISVPIGRNFTYFYRPHDPGTYMYHCHFEDVEHVQMGMTGLLFVRPKQNGTSITVGGRLHQVRLQRRRRVDGVRPRVRRSCSTEIFVEGHYRDAHIQTTDWTDFKASFWCINGRTYPDTVKPNAPYTTTLGYRPAWHGRCGRGRLAVPAAVVAGHLQRRATGCSCGCPTWATRTTR